MSDNLYRSDKDLPLLISFISFRFSLSNSAAFAVAQAQRHTGFCDISNSHSLQFFMHQRKFDSIHKLFLSLSFCSFFLSSSFQSIIKFSFFIKCCKNVTSTRSPRIKIFQVIQRQ